MSDQEYKRRDIIDQVCKFTGDKFPNTRKSLKGIDDQTIFQLMSSAKEGHTPKKLFWWLVNRWKTDNNLKKTENTV